MRSARITASSILCVTMKIARVGIFLPLPQLQQFSPQRFRGQHVQRGKRLVHEQNFRFDHQRPRHSHSLLHPSGKFFRVSGLKPIQPHRVDNTQRTLVPLKFSHPARLERRFHILNHRKPRKQRKALEHDRHIRRLVLYRLPVPVHASARSRRKPCQHPQHRRFSAPRRPQQCNNLSRINRDIGRRNHLNPISIRLRIKFLELACFNDRFNRRRCSCCRCRAHKCPYYRSISSRGEPIPTDSVAYRVSPVTIS